MNIIVDIDDCLMPWAEKVHQACAAAGITGGKDYASWHMWEDYGCTKEAWLEVVDGLVVPGGIYHEPPYPGAVEALRRLLWADHRIFLVTARGFMEHADEIRAWTTEWVEEFAVPGELIFSKQKDQVARLVRADRAVDDGFHNWEAMTNAGVLTYMVNQPHNQSAPVPPELRVDTVVEFVDRILEEA